MDDNTVGQAAYYFSLGSRFLDPAVISMPLSPNLVRGAHEYVD